MTISYSITVILLGITISLTQEFKPYFRYLMILTQRSFLMELLQIGVPMGLMYCVEVAFFFTLSLLMGSFGSQYLAGNQITLQYVGIFTSVIFSIAQGITVRMGHLLGAGEIKSAAKAGYMGVCLATSLMIIIAIIYWIYPDKLISVDIDVNNHDNSKLIYHAKQFLMIGALFQIVEAIRLSFFGILRGLKDTNFTLLISILSFWGIALPIGYLLTTYFNFIGTGFWWGMILGSLVGVILLYYRFKLKINCYQLTPNMQ